MNLIRQRKLETLIYAGLWVVVVALCVLDMMRARSYTTQPLLDWSMLGRISVSMALFMVLFAIHNYLLVPRLLFQNRYVRYLVATMGLVAVVWSLQYLHFFHVVMEQLDVPRHHGGGNGPRPLLPLPLFLDLVYDFLIIGVNLAIALIFQRFEDKLEHESLLKTNAETRLSYLKAQINPHFYLNMLNNIHGMIEIDSEKAQEMVIDMSNLMRYMLYDSSRGLIELSAEIGFLRNYLNVMRQRFPESKVRISAQLPQEKATAGVMIPPLLFLVFIENAFKHGISYRHESFVSVGVEVADGAVKFCCINSVHPQPADKSREGIGLDNVNQRLKLIFGSRFNLDIRMTDTTYSVNLTIPANETTDVNC